MAESLAEFFTTNFQAHAHERAYGQRRGYRMQWFTYGQVLAMTCRFARELEARQIGKGDRVMLWGENGAEWVAVFFGCVLRGAVVVPMDNGASTDFAARVFGQVDAKLMVGSRPHAKEAADKFPAATPTLILEDLPKALANHSPVPIPNAGFSREDILQIVFTSGTTTEPKGVVITHGNVLANVAPLEKEMQRYRKYERFVHPVRFLNLLPLSHVFGQFLGMFLPPLLGGTVLFQEELKPSEIIRTIHRERVSVLVSVPRVLQSLKQKLERDLEDQGELSSFHRRFRSAETKHFLRRWWIFRKIRRQFGWKFWAFICGGAALDRETEEFWGRLGYAAIQGYGLTETTSLISVNHPFKLGKGSIGKVLPGRELKLAEDGEILVRGGGVASAYWDVSGRHDLAGDQGWYRTGDVGALDAAGNLYFKGRKKEVIVTPAGLNIYPEDLEAALRQQPEIKDCVVVGLDRNGKDRNGKDRDGNAEPCAVVILRQIVSNQAHSETTLGEITEGIIQRANQTLADYQRMRMWFQWPQQDFPRTSTQKSRKNLIQEVAQNHFLRTESESASVPSPRQTSESLAELITRVVRRPIRSLKTSDKLESDLGLSSLDRAELLGALEDRYQVDLSEARFSAARTVDDLEGLLRGEMAHGEAAPGELQQEDPQKAAYHYPRWTLRWPITWLRFLAHYLLLRPSIVLLGWPHIEGRENLRGVNGPLLVVCNHIADVDFAFVQTALPARFRKRLATATRGEALEALRTPPPSRGFFASIYDRTLWMLGVSLLNLFPLPRETRFRQSFAYAGGAVDRGYSILVFPEGLHTADGTINPFRAGIGLLVNNLGVPVLPMRILGLFELKQAGKRFAAPWKIGVRIGHPMNFAPGTDPETIAAELQKAVELL